MNSSKFQDKNSSQNILSYYELILMVLNLKICMFFYCNKCNITVTYTQFIFYVVYVCISQTRIFPERVVERSTGSKMCCGLNMMSKPFVILAHVTSVFQ